MPGQSTAISNPVGSSLWQNRRFFLGVVAAIHLVCALQSGGWYALDEHFQTIEFAGYKLGFNQPSDLSWEFHYRMRPGLQPAVAYAVIGTCRAIGVENPFVASLVLRLLSGLLGVICLWVLYRALASRLKSNAARAWFAALSCLLWFLPYQHVRFSSESWSGAFFWTGTALVVLEIERQNGARRAGAWLCAGLLLGLSLVTRLQAGPLVLPVLIWLALRKSPRRIPGILLVGVTAALLLGLLCERWMYGEWTLSAWNYFKVNQLYGASHYFGDEPWWFYPVRVVERGVYPVGFAILMAGIVYVLTRPRDLVTWILVPFLLVHSLVGHKEIRFLFPLVSILPFVLVAAGESFVSWRWLRASTLRWKFAAGLLAVTFVLNQALLVVACLKPAEPVYSLYKFIYDRYGSNSITMFYDSENPYERARFSPALYPDSAAVVEEVVPPRPEVVLEARFYKPHGLKAIPWNQEKALPFEETCIYVTRSNNTPEAPGLKFKRVYRYLPDWLMKLKVTGWTERTQIWSVYEVSGVNPP